MEVDADKPKNSRQRHERIRVIAHDIVKPDRGRLSFTLLKTTSAWSMLSMGRLVYEQFAGACGSLLRPDTPIKLFHQQRVFGCDVRPLPLRAGYQRASSCFASSAPSNFGFFASV